MDAQLAFTPPMRGTVAGSVAVAEAAGDAPVKFGLAVDRLGTHRTSGGCRGRPEHAGRHCLTFVRCRLISGIGQHLERRGAYSSMLPPSVTLSAKPDPVASHRAAAASDGRRPVSLRGVTALGVDGHMLRNEALLPGLR